MGLMCGDDVTLARNLAFVKSVCASPQSVHKTSQTLANLFESCYNNTMDLQRTRKVTRLTTLQPFEFFGIRTFPQPVENPENQKV